ncbi:MAG: helix-turn-helix transcriptional regulator [Betaproteobacteria bacterium]|nr:helix-turn-helix transcriptional regulator [Betaproteobacteria bacterium]
MDLHHLTDKEIALRLAQALRAWRIAPTGAGMTQAALAEKSGIGLTPLKRFEKTGGITLGNLIAILRALDLLDGIERLVPDPNTPSPLELAEIARAQIRRQRAPRASSKKGAGSV